MWLSISFTALWLACGALAAEDPQANPAPVKSVPLRTHSLNSPYLDSDMQSRWFDFGGNTIIRTDKYVRLTSDRPSQSGWIFSRVPLTATNWEIEVEFKLHGKGTLHGDGFAMWITKQRATPGPVFGSVDNFEGLGIFFDTYKNNRPGTVFPYVMAMVADGNTPYDKANDGKANEFAGCSARGIRTDSVATKARLTYFQDKSMKLELQYKSEDKWELCFETDQPPTIPSVAYLGFSAETGELSDNHDIISVNTKNLYNTNRAESSRSGSSSGSGRGKDRKLGKAARRSSGSWSWFFFKTLMFFVVCGGGYIGYTAWRTQQKKTHRF